MSVEIPTIVESETVGAEKEIKLEEIAEPEAPIKKIIEKIRLRIENGEYGLIIGDDASGRIPALILGNFIKKVSELKGLNKPNIIFIPGKLKMESGGRFFNRIPNFLKKKQYQELDEYLSKQGASKEKRILIITDAIQSGFSLKTLMDLLGEAGYRYDIATIGIEEPMIGKTDRNKNFSGADIFSGEYYRKDNNLAHTPRIYGRYDLSGVVKGGDITGKMYSIPYKGSSEDVIGFDPEIQKDINQSREDAKIVTNHLIDWYESQKQNEK